jgi:hypothetical protein
MCSLQIYHPLLIVRMGRKILADQPDALLWTASCTIFVAGWEMGRPFEVDSEKVIDWLRKRGMEV